MDAGTVTPPAALGWESAPPSPPAPVGSRKLFNYGSIISRKLMFDDDDDAVTPTPPMKLLFNDVTSTPPPPQKHLAPRRLFQPAPTPTPPQKTCILPLPKVVAPPPRTWTSGFEAISVKWNQRAMDAYFGTSTTMYMR